MANRQTGFKTLVMCAPPVDKDEGDEYAPYNSVDDFRTLPILILAADNWEPNESAQKFHWETYDIDFHSEHRVLDEEQG